MAAADHPLPAGRERRTGAGTPPARRGRLRIADRVLQRIAERAAQEALGPDPVGGRPRVSVTVVGRGARVWIRLDLPFPGDLAAWVEAVRARVAERVGRMAGIEVREVDVTVEHLVPVGLFDGE
ncbi:alkaline shock response membrane anchor protein AmaP [Kitasatospora sp. RB6PN24]|uniref:Asp23/Gls24 family envelope stress response protein n=1 Tax=Kitasatospora humi TaxID=2893891 RepID=UPI001E60CCDE|nr:alkaline shock response membrane anchor protein AmaP [Kitasatospora humi]MCC9308262.1 alkaline shock response membrane anchor protein AmaP [Kitasatospora humi]